jgi:hypothetical protein
MSTYARVAGPHKWGQSPPDGRGDRFKAMLANVAGTVPIYAALRALEGRGLSPFMRGCAV